MSVLDLIFKSKPKEASSVNASSRSVVVKKVNSVYFFSGQNTLQTQLNNKAGISQIFANLLKLRRTSNTLNSADEYQQYAYISDYHPYGKKAASIYKSFCCNEIEYDKAGNDRTQEFNDYLSGLLRNQKGIIGTYALQTYLIKAILNQGGVAFWLDIDEEDNIQIINIPFHSITAVKDAKTNLTKYSTNKINLGAINASLADNEKYEFASDLPQFQIFFFDVDFESQTPIPFFSAAVEDCYTENLWRAGIRELINRLSFLKYAHFKIKPPEVKDYGAHDLFSNEEAELQKQTEAQKAVEEIKGEIANPTGKMVNNPETDKNCAFFAGMSITDETVDIDTYSTLETASIKPIQGVVERPLSAGLRVPAQFLGISESNTETQIEIELELFLENESELRNFMAEILKSLIQFRAFITGQKLGKNFSVSIKESDVVGALKRQKAAKEKAETQGLQLANLKIKKELGFEVSEKEIKDIGFEATKLPEPTNATPQDNSQASPNTVPTGSGGSVSNDVSSVIEEIVE